MIRKLFLTFFKAMALCIVSLWLAPAMLLMVFSPIGLAFEPDVCH